MLIRWLAAFAASLAFLPSAGAEVPVPALKSRVTDLTGTLSIEQKGNLEQRLAAFEARKGSQVVLLMLPTTQPEAIEQFSIRVAEAWKIGRKGTDDGVILVVAKDDRRLRIEVGYGLEGAIPDATARRVISEVITPRFKAGDFYGGVSAGVDRIITLADGEKLPPPSDATSGESGRDPFDFIVPGIIFVVVAGGVLKSILGRFPGSIATAGIAGLAAWVLFSLGVAGIVAFIVFILTLMNTDNLSSGGGGGFSSGGGSSGGGFSGGGGSFGGGGSSGRW